VLDKEVVERIIVEFLVVGKHFHQPGQVGKEIPLVPIGEDGWNRGVVEFDLFVVDLDEVDSRVLGHDGYQRVLDCRRYGALQSRLG